MPVRVRIHSSEVSTIFSRSAFVITRSGTWVPRAVIAARRWLMRLRSSRSACALAAARGRGEQGIRASAREAVKPTDRAGETTIRPARASDERLEARPQGPERDARVAHDPDRLVVVEGLDVRVMEGRPPLDLGEHLAEVLLVAPDHDQHVDRRRFRL